MATTRIMISRKEYKELKEKAELNESLLLKLVRGLEDVKAGRITPWKSHH